MSQAACVQAVRKALSQIAKEGGAPIELNALLVRVGTDAGLEDGFVDLAIIQELQAGRLNISRVDNRSRVVFTELGLDYFRSYVEEDSPRIAEKQRAINEYLALARVIEPVMEFLLERSPKDTRLYGVDSLPEVIREYLTGVENMQENNCDLRASITDTEELVQRLQAEVRKRHDVGGTVARDI